VETASPPQPPPRANADRQVRRMDIERYKGHVWKNLAEFRFKLVFASQSFDFGRSSVPEGGGKCLPLRISNLNCTA
jgi:hypothetical protein